MKVLVAIKHVPDTETKIRPAADGRGIDESAVAKWIVSPYDEYAIEAGLRLKEAGVATEVVLVSCGREAAQATLRQGLAMGADRAVHVADGALERADALTRSRAIAGVAKRVEAGLALFGKYGVGTDEGLTGPMVAELLGWPHAAGVSALTVGDGAFRAERPIEGAVEIVEGRLPAVVTCDKGLNDPRYPSLKGIMAAKKKAVETLTAAEVGLDAAALDAGAVVWEAVELPPERPSGRIVDGSPAEAARELARLLREEAKVI